MNNKVKAFYQKHETIINIAALTLISAGLFALSFKVKAISSMLPTMKNADDLTDEEWDHLIEMGRQMDEYVAERRALKTK